MKNFKLFVVSVLIAFSFVFSAQAETTATVFKSPTCGCCEEYINYLQKNGFTVKSVNESDMDVIKKRYKVPETSASCHTSLIDGYVVEGHVPVGAIRKLLKVKPNIVGISAPGMPANSPGMGEMKKGTLEIYTIPKNKGNAVLFSIE